MAAGTTLLARGVEVTVVCHASAPKSSAVTETTTVRCATYLLDEMHSLILEVIYSWDGGDACAADD